MKRKYMIIVLMAGALELTGCSQGTSNSAKNGTTGSENTIISESDIAILDTEDMFTERDRDTEYDESECTAISLSDEETKCDSDGVKMDGQTVTITEGGTYLLTGSLSNGSVVVDTDKTEKVQLILENVSIINEEGAGICVEQADKVFITLADGSTNKIVSNSFTGNEDTNIDGAIFSREDLTLNGSGTLKITSAAHGIVSKDDLVLTGGVYQIQSEKQGLSGKESVRIADGTFTITSGTDAIHSEDTDEDTKGFVYITGGVLTLAAGGEGISSSYVVQADGGSFDISTSSTETDTSTKGIKAQKYVILKDGTYQLATADDGIHCNGNVYVCGGTYSINSGDDGSHAVDCNVSQLAAGKTDKSHAVLLSHELSHVTSRTNHLSALTGVHLDVVDNGTNRDISQCKSVAGLDISVAACANGVADLQAVRSDDISLLAVLIGNESDESRSVRIVLKSGNSSVHALLISLAVDNTILLSVAAADMSNGDSAVAVAACGLLNGLQK